MAISYQWRNKELCHGALLATILISNPAYPGVVLDKIDQCGQVTALYQDLSMASGWSADRCRRDKSELERALIHRMSPEWAKSACFLEQPPKPFLTGFSCVTVRYSQTAGGILCTRSAARDDIADFKEHVADRYAQAVEHYLAVAHDCAGTSHDSSAVLPTLVPPLLTPIAHMEFGFMSGLDGAVPSRANILHGFALTDPALPADVPPAVEFVSIDYGQSLAAQSEPTRIAGRWKVAYGEHTTDMRKLSILARDAGVAMFGETAFLTPTRETENAEPADKKLQRIERLLAVEISALKEAGFRRISNSALEHEAGMSYDDFKDRVKSSMPYAWRAAGLLQLAPTVAVMISRDRLACSRRNGMLMAVVAGSAPKEAVAEDYGGVFVSIVGIRDCGGRNGSAHEFAADTKAAVVGQVMHTLEGD